MTDPNVRTLIPLPPEEWRHRLWFLEHPAPPRWIRGEVSRSGFCYETAAEWVITHADHLPSAVTNRLGMRLIHGSIQGADFPRIGHTWIELRHPAQAWEQYAFEPVAGITAPVKEFRRFANARAVRQYSPDSTRRLVVQTGHTGPWHPRPFGIDDCPHGHEPRTEDRDPEVNPRVCPYGCTDDTLKEEA